MIIGLASILAALGGGWALQVATLLAALGARTASSGWRWLPEIVAAASVRALVSAADASQAFDLRCTVREALLGFLRREHPQRLPRLRVEGDAAPAQAAPAPGTGLLGQVSRERVVAQPAGLAGSRTEASARPSA